MLPDEIQKQTFGRIAGVDMTLQEALTLAFALGFGVAKVPALWVMSSTIYFQHRFAMLTSLCVLGAVLSTLPLALSHGNPQITALGLFLGCFPQSWIYGGMVVYLEGRRSTELLFAIMTFSFIFGGSASRGTATAVLGLGVDACWMPFIISMAVLLPALSLLFLLDRLPPPSLSDIAQRRARRAMSSEERYTFIRTYWPGISLCLVAYASITALRQFRDLFTLDLLTAANHGVQPSSITFLFLDMPGAVLSGVIVGTCVWFRDNRRALLVMLSIMITFLVCMAGATAVYYGNEISGVVWQMLVGAGILGSYSFMSGSPVYDRLVSASYLNGATSSFLIFFGDVFGYTGTIALMLWKTFAARGSQTQSILRQFYFAQASLSSVSIVCLLLAIWYFSVKLRLPQRSALSSAQTSFPSSL